MLPINYFIILYSTVYIISPFINGMLRNLSKRDLRILLVSLMLLFSVYPTAVDVLGNLHGAAFIGLSTLGMYGSQWGYCLVNFTLMYILGAYIRMGDPRMLSWGKGKLFCGIAACVLLMVAWARFDDVIGYDTERSAWEYCNFLVIFEAVLVFCLFLKIKLQPSKVINKLASASITVFLAHGYVMPYLQVERFVNASLGVMLLHIAVSAVVIYLLFFCVHIVYSKVADAFFAFLARKIDLHFEIEHV